MPSYSTGVQMRSFGIMCYKGVYETLDSAPYGRPDAVIRINRMLTTASKPEINIITGLYIDKVNQLMMPIDAYQFSAANAQKIREAFLYEHGLERLGSEDIQRYLDHKEISIPDPTRVVLGTISPDKEVHITGVFNEGFVISFFGLSSG